MTNGVTGAQLPMLPVAGFDQITTREADRLLTSWGHYLGPCARPFGVEPWLFAIDGRPVSVAVGASTVSSTAAGMPRRELVELARLCTDPAERWATRVALRLWREIAAPRWPHWPVSAAVAYSKDDRHEGRIYRFDGWEKFTTGKPSGGGGGWTGTRRAGDAAAGAKTGWLWRYAA